MIDSVSTLLAVVLGGVLLLWVLHFRSSWHRASKSGARLPGGSSGWPILGESISFGRNPETYAVSRNKRYGSIFRSHLFLQNAVLGTTPDFARFVTSNRQLFTFEAPPMVKMIIPNGFVLQEGPSHSSIKKILQEAFLPEALHTRIEMLETIILRNLESWVQKGTVSGRDAMRRITLEAAAYFLFGMPNIGCTAEGASALHNLETLGHALFALPLDFPGSPCNKAKKAKAALASFTRNIVKERRGKQHNGNDTLGVFMTAIDDPEAREEIKALDDGAVVDNLVSMWFGFYETNSTALVWVLKFLAENPGVYRRVLAEQDEILRRKDLQSVDGPRLTWEDTKEMVYTSKFFKELQRTMSIGAILPRRATQDIEYSGYLIPKGWLVFPLIHFIHSDPSNYPNPTSFNPDRFDETPKPFTYLPFGYGTHMCPGGDVAKLISFVFIHHITTNYIFERAAPDQGTEYSPLRVPAGGYSINIRRRNC